MSNKITILYLLDILKRKTDEQHPLTSSELINEIYEASHHQITIERKAIYRDIQTLIDYGHDILQTRENNRRGYYYANSDFEVAEIRLLMDAVEASSSISHKKSQQLIQKLSKLVNEHNEKDLQNFNKQDIDFFIDYDKISNSAVVRNRRDGDSYQLPNRPNKSFKKLFNDIFYTFSYFFTQ